VVSWYVLMGVGQVVAPRVPPERLRDVNRAIDASAWDGFRTEFYPSYDFKAIAAQQRNCAPRGGPDSCGSPALPPVARGERG
jgi:hypothetical protein